jgi:hypothetical protein
LARILNLFACIRSVEFLPYNAIPLKTGELDNHKLLSRLDETKSLIFRHELTVQSLSDNNHQEESAYTQSHALSQLIPLIFLPVL